MKHKQNCLTREEVRNLVLNCLAATLDMAPPGETAYIVPSMRLEVEGEDMIFVHTGFHLRELGAEMVSLNHWRWAKGGENG